MTAALHGAYEKQPGFPASGWIVVEVDTESQVIRDTTGKIVFQGPWKLRLVDGEVTADLPASDVETNIPTGFSVTVTEMLDHVDEDDYRVVSFAPMDGETVELADLLSADEAALTPEYQNIDAATLSAVQAQLADVEAAATATRVVVDSTARATRASIMVGAPRVYDNFARPDVADLGGLLSRSGHTYITGNSGANRMAVINGRMVPTGVTETGTADAVGILYALDDRPLGSVAAEFVFTGGEDATTGSENVVLGAAVRTFGRGSIQLAIYPVQRPGNPAIQWQLFAPVEPQIEPYPTIAEGPIDVDFDRTGGTRYRVAMHRTGTDQLTLELPDGSVVVVDDELLDVTTGRSLIDTYWGPKAAWQLRRNYITDGYAEFLSIATAEAA